jgi:glutamate dehydrogenase (NADP+)
MAHLVSEPEFEQARAELWSTLEGSTLFQKKPHLQEYFKVIEIPERIIQFRVVWEDDKGQMQVPLLIFFHTVLTDLM